MSTLTPQRPTKAERKEQARAARIAAAQAEQANEARRRRAFALGGAALVALLAVVALLVAGPSADDGAKPSGSAVAGATEVREMLAGIPQDGTVLGDPGAPVTLVEFADLQCPYCRDFAKDVLPLVVQDYVRPGKVKLDFRLLAFLGPDSVRGASTAAAAAAQDRLWNLTDLWYWNQGEEHSGYGDDAFLRRLAAKVPGLDAGRAFAERDGAAAQRQLADAKALAQRHGLASTPSFVVARGGDVEGGEPIEGLQSYEQLRERLDEALKAS